MDLIQTIQMFWQEHMNDILIVVTMILFIGFLIVMLVADYMGYMGTSILIISQLFAGLGIAVIFAEDKVNDQQNEKTSTSYIHSLPLKNVQVKQINIGDSQTTLTYIEGDHTQTVVVRGNVSYTKEENVKKTYATFYFLPKDLGHGVNAGAYDVVIHEPLEN